ncbi:hypothetical protein J4419_00105 [Candidatus Woesearchaeota archaeon]|nr:hypothetical protein [Candidatus Woesearchaeota archaeon]
MYITKKRFGKKVYYYIVENKIINGRPTMKHVLYLGTVQKILGVFREFLKKKV